MISPPHLNESLRAPSRPSPIGDRAANDIDETLAREPDFRVSPQ
jgi:hypothetical protein